MSARTVTLHEAETRLRELLDLAERGEDVQIAVDNDRRFRLVAVPAASGGRHFGRHRGKARMHDDFDAPLPEGFWLGGKP